MAYPHPDNIAQIIGSNVSGDDGVRMSRAVSGKPRFRTQYTQVWREFTVIHECQDSTQFETLMTAYDEDKYDEFSFIWAATGEEVLVRYLGPPQVQPLEGDFRVRVTNRLIEV